MWVKGRQHIHRQGESGEHRHRANLASGLCEGREMPGVDHWRWPEMLMDTGGGGGGGEPLLVRLLTSFSFFKYLF